MKDLTKSIVAAALLAMLPACTAGQPSDKKDEERATDDPGEGKDGASTAEESPDVPVPIFLTDPEAAFAEASASVDSVSLGDSDDTEMFSASNSAQAYQESFSKSYTSLGQTFKAIIQDQFKGQAVVLKGGVTATFDVSALNFPERMPLRFLKVSADTSADPVSYEVVGFCEKSADAVKGCLKFTFAESATPRVRLFADWTETQAAVGGDWASLTEYGGGKDLTSAFRRANSEDKVVDHVFGLGFPATITPDRHALTLVMLNDADGKPPVVQPDLPRNRFARSERRKGDYWVVQGAAQPSAGRLVRRQAFLPFSEAQGKTTLESGLFASNALSGFVGATQLARVRDPETNPDCSTTGVDVRGGYVGGSVPAAVSSLPDDLCQETTTTTDAQVLAALAEVCGSGGHVPLDLVVNRKLNTKVAIDVCELEGSRKALANPQFYQVADGIKTQIYGADAEPLAPLAAEVDGMTQPFELKTMTDLKGAQLPEAAVADLQAEAKKTAEAK